MKNFIKNKRPFLHQVVNLFAAALVFLTCLTFAAQEFWIADIVANLRIQLAIGIGVVMLAGLVFRRKVTVIALASCIVVHGFWCLPASTVQSCQEPILRVCTINVQTTNRQHERVMAAVREANPDIVAIVELSSALEVAWADSELQGKYPFQLTAARDDGNFGIGLFSKHPLVSVRQVDFSDVSLPSIVADVRIEGSDFHIVATHTLPPMGGRPSEVRNDHLLKLADHCQHQADRNSDAGLVVMGDFNLTPWSPWFSRFMDQSSLHRSYSGISPTWYAGPGFPFGLQLDHILVSSNVTVGATDIGDDIGSDHRAVSVEIGLERR